MAKLEATYTEVPLRKFAFGLVLSLAAPASFAGQVRCIGNYWPYTVEARTRFNGSSISAPIAVTMSGPFGGKHSSRLDATSSEVQLGQYIHVKAKGPDGEGDLTAKFAGGSTYNGTLDAQTPMGAVQVSVSCEVSNSWHLLGF